MTPSDRIAHWNEIYGSKAPDQVSWFQAVPEPSMGMIRSSGIAKDAAIVDIGGGASVLVDELLAAEFTDVSVLDVAETAIERTITRLGQRAVQVNWIVADVLSWAPRRTYDLWHDRAVFHFLIEERERAEYRVTLDKALMPGSSLIIATFAEDGPDRCSGLPVKRWSADALANELRGFQLEDSFKQAHMTPSGAAQSFTWARFLKL